MFVREQLGRALFQARRAQDRTRRQDGLLHRGRGFTLVDAAVALVILGLLMGGVLKAQELIQGRRVRALIAHQSDVKTAFFAFYDRHWARCQGTIVPPARTLIVGLPPGLDGDGDGRIQASPSNLSNGNNGNHNGNGNGNHGNRNNGNVNKGNNGNGGQSATIDDGLLAWTHLSAAGFLNGRFTLTSGAVTTPDDSNSPKNPYGAYLQILFDNSWSYSTNPALRHNMKTANLIPVAILAEIDRKIDDGRSGSGRFQFSTALLGPTPDTDVPPVLRQS